MILLLESSRVRFPQLAANRSAAKTAERQGEGVATSHRSPAREAQASLREPVYLEEQWLKEPEVLRYGRRCATGYDRSQ